MRKAVFYTFGNHMHWIDMEWMWGPGTLKNSVEEMLKLVGKGLKGAINFDAVGYEYLAWKHPETFQKLKEAIEDGKIEIAAGTYTQPYPLFIGEESNIQQIIFGIKACERLFGVRPKLFWEEEFYFFPQLPQILRQAGYEVYNFFFQETWHTPRVPKSSDPTFIWEGKDGTRIDAIAFTDLCVHQWPEDLEKSLSTASQDEQEPVLIQWLELMDSPKWMCRAELIEAQFEKMKERFDFKPIKPSEIVSLKKPSKVLSFRSFEVYHGLSIGKNGGVLQIERRNVENDLLDAQTLATVAYLYGLSPQWADYPAWEFEEAQRLLMISQAHDIDECEGFCGDIGKVYLRTARSLVQPVIDRYMKLFAKNVDRTFDLCVFNALPWKRNGYARLEETHEFVEVQSADALSISGIKKTRSTQIDAQLSDGTVKIRWHNAEYGVLPNGIIKTQLNGRSYKLNELRCEDFTVESLQQPILKRHLPSLAEVDVKLRIGPYQCEQSILFGELNDWIEIETRIELLEKPKPGYRGALMLELNAGNGLNQLCYDYPFGIEKGLPEIKHYRYYPKGSWMTSEKFFETIENHFAALRFVQLETNEMNLLFLHSGSHGFVRDGSRVFCVLYLYDPWDEENYARTVKTRYAFSPFNKENPLKLAQEFNRPMRATVVQSSDRGRPIFQPFEIDGNIQLSAIYVDAGSVVLRIWNPHETHEKVRILPKFEVAKIKKTNLLGDEEKEVGSELILRPFEIVTLRFEVPKRIEKNLDEYRYVWSEFQKKEVDRA